MRLAGLEGRAKKRWRATTIADPDAAAAAERIRRAFAPGGPTDARYVGDITYIATWQGWAYLATVIDLSNAKSLYGTWFAIAPLRFSIFKCIVLKSDIWPQGHSRKGATMRQCARVSAAASPRDSNAQHDGLKKVAAGHARVQRRPTESSSSQNLTAGTGSQERSTDPSGEKWLPPEGCLLVAALAVGYAGQGGFHPLVQRLMAAALIAAAAVAWWRRRSAFLVHPLLWASLAALAAWAVVSAVVNGEPTGAVGTVTLAVGMVGAVSITSGFDGEERDLFVIALLMLGCVVALTGWLGVVAHTNIELWTSDLGVRRASTSLTYPNAAAALLAALTLVAISRAARHRTMSAHATVCVLVTGLLATFSRGGAASFAVGVLALSILLGPRGMLRGAVPGLLGAGVALTVASQSFVFAPSAGVLRATAFLGLGVAMAAVVGRRGDRVILATASVALAATAIAVWRGAMSGLVDNERWSFVSPLRGGAIPAAIDLGLERPVFGAGPGQGVFGWQDPNGRFTTRYAHNEYAQTFAETGVLGLVLIVALFAATCVLLIRYRRTHPARLLGSGVAAALVTFAVHSGGDFLWRIPVLPLTVAALVGLAIQSRPRDPDVRLRTRCLSASRQRT